MVQANELPFAAEHAQIYTPSTNDSTTPIPLGPGPHLFIDDFLIAESGNVTRKVVPPERTLDQPVVTGKEDGCFQPYMTILRDPDSGRFRIWYGHHTDDFNGGRSLLAHMDSADGIQWNRPPQLLEGMGAIQFGVSVIDRGRGFTPADQRYLYAWYMDDGIRLAASPDGFAWTPLSDGSFIRHNHDITGFFHDPIRDRYTAITSVYIPSDRWAGDRRVTMQSHSTDLETWSTPQYIVAPDDSTDPGQTQFYAMDGFLARGPLLIGMVKVLRDELKVDDPPDPPEAYGMGYTTLAWTRDGETWYRDQTHYFDPDPTKGEWDHAHAWIDEQVPVDDRVFLYYGGYARGHKVNRFEERQIGLLTIPRDRYVARAAGDAEGRIVTPPLVLDGTRLYLNADAAGGEIRVQVLGENGEPLEGLTFDDCAPLTEDSLAADVAWKANLPQGAPVRLAFSLKNARLYAFELR